jgi:hypothetical protein
MRFIVLAGLLAHGCSGGTGHPSDDDDDDDDDDGDGDDRLMPIYAQVGADRQLVGWFDTKLGVECQIVAINGGYQCVPTEQVTLVDDNPIEESDYLDSLQADCGSYEVFNGYVCYDLPVLGLWASGDYHDDTKSCGDRGSIPLEQRSWYLLEPLPTEAPVYYYGVHGGLCCSCTTAPQDGRDLTDAIQYKIVPLTADNTPLAVVPTSTGL